jgi:hypothetical protein
VSHTLFSKKNGLNFNLNRWLKLLFGIAINIEDKSSRKKSIFAAYLVGILHDKLPKNAKLMERIHNGGRMCPPRQESDR